MFAMFYFSLKCYPENIDKEALLFGTPMYLLGRTEKRQSVSQHSLFAVIITENRLCCET